MKKYLRLLLCVFTALLSVSLVCSCESIDEMRARQAFYDDDGNVLFNGEKYIRIDGEYDVFDGYGDSVIITQKDVPVLLAEKYGDWYSIAEGGEYLYSYGEDTFLREDSYKEFENRYGGKIEINRFGFEYLDEDMNRQIYILTQEEQKTIEIILSSDEKEVYHDEYPEIYDQFDRYMNYYSEDGIFVNRNIQFFLYKMDVGYCLGVEENKENRLEFDYTHYTVPEEYYPLFDKLMNVDTEETE